MLIFVKASRFQKQQEKEMNEYDIIETHVDDGDDMQDTNCGENTTKTVEKEVLLRMTNVDSKTIKLSREEKKNFKNKVKCFCIMLYNS